MIEILHSKLTKKQERYVLSGKYRGKFLGSGATAEVVAFDRNKVIRVQEKYQDYDPAKVIPWVKYCLRSRSNHVPKLYFAAQEVVDGEVVKVVTVLERLEEADGVHATDDDAWFVGDYLNGWHTAKNISLETYSEQARKKFPLRAVRSMRKTLKKHGVCMNDLHGGNWMYRPRDGRLVITDPIC